MQTDSEEQHKEKQQQLKEAVDERVRNATEKKGVLYVVTGNGKGKSTAAFGTALRAVGHDKKVVVAQFIKGKWPCGERKVLEKLGVEFQVMATGFTWNTQDREKDTQAALQTWKAIKPALSDSTVDLVLLDELTYMLNYEYLDRNEVFEALANRPSLQHVIVTGRGADEQLVALADTVSDVTNVKHAFESGVKAQFGFDF